MQAKSSRAFYRFKDARFPTPPRARLVVVPEQSNLVSMPKPRVRRRAKMANDSIAKRGMDIMLAAIGLFFLLPLMLVIAAAIRLDSRGPIFFRQERYGKGGVPFMIIKFRSMSVLESRGEFAQAAKDDARVTRVGRFLRSTSIDELPQLINVLVGEMSLVGPRPHARTMDDRFGMLLPGYTERHLVRPGLTGLAQVEGLRGPTDTLESIELRLAKDRVYIRNWSLWVDMVILLRTPLALLKHPAF